MKKVNVSLALLFMAVASIFPTAKVDAICCSTNICCLYVGRGCEAVGMECVKHWDCGDCGKNIQ